MQKQIRAIALGLLVPFLLCIPSCGNKKTQDVVTLHATEGNRIPITVLVKNAFRINSFEEKVELKFPNIDIIQVGNYSRDMGIAEYEARMEHDDLTDIVMTWPLSAGEEFCSERLIDLSTQPFSSKYNTARLGRVSQNGKLYYLPGPSQIRGIMYNKTMFREQGLSVPKDFDGFLELCKKIEATGVRALQLGLGNEEVLDTAFVGYSIAECFSSPAAVQWLADYNTAGVGNFGEHFGSALDTFKRLIDNKVLRPNDINLTYADRENMIFNRKCAMVEDSVLLARTGSSYNGCTDEFGLMPFFNPGKDGDWARLYPVCYIGLNKHLEESANKEKYELILELMEYISSPDGQYALLGDTGAMISSLIGVPPPDVPEIADIMPALQHGRCSVFPVLKNAQSALREGLAGMITGKFTASDVAQAVDAQNAAPAKPVPPKILGEARDDFSLTDTGNFITDAMKKKSGCEIALFLDNGKDGQTNGKGVCARLYKGDVTSVDLDRILPDLRKNEKCVLWKVKMTGADLLRTLEYSIPIENIQASWFYYFSGLSMDYAPTAKTGAHTSNVRDEHGNAIDPNRTYSVAVMDYSVPPDACISCEKTNITIRSILEEALSGGAVSPAKDGRFNIISAK